MDALLVDVRDDDARDRAGRRFAAQVIQTLDNLLLNTSTPYGPVMQSLRVAKADGSSLQVRFAHPKAYLWMLFTLSQPWAAFLAAELPQGESGITIYMDDCRPGNVHRPDPARTY